MGERVAVCYKTPIVTCVDFRAPRSVIPLFKRQAPASPVGGPDPNAKTTCFTTQAGKRLAIGMDKGVLVYDLEKDDFVALASPSKGLFGRPTELQKVATCVFHPFKFRLTLQQGAGAITQLRPQV
jgi:hypothetical protein